MLYILLFFLGAIFGSFANLVINRTIKGESIISPPSHCESCGHRLQAWDLVPIFSFLFLKGKCRYCEDKISYENLIVEIIVGLLALIFINTDELIKSTLLFFAILLALIVAVIDFKSFDIYMNQIAILTIIGIIYRYNFLGYNLEFIQIALIFTMIYAILYFTSQKSMGDGDIYFYLALFLFLPNHKIIYFILLSIWLGAISGIFIAIKNKSTKIPIPFCIYIFLSFLILNLPGV
ncbi:Type 4 prepilin-like proteins leader peptide-processing enzyme [subsurface metagenome]